MQLISAADIMIAKEGLRMKCDYCDTDIQEISANGLCPFCGALLSVEEKPTAMTVYPEPPVGKYLGNNGHIEIGHDSVTLCFVRGFPKQVSRIFLSFADIEDSKLVVWKRTACYLTVKDFSRKNRFYMPARAHTFGPMSLIFNPDQAKAMDKLHQFLSACAEINQKTGEDGGRFSVFERGGLPHQ